MLLPSVWMLHAFFIEGENQARLVGVIAGSAWFGLLLPCYGAILANWNQDVMEMTFAENIPPLVIWGLTALSGVLHGNFQDSRTGESQ